MRYAALSRVEVIPKRLSRTFRNYSKSCMKLNLFVGVVDEGSQRRNSHPVYSRDDDARVSTSSVLDCFYESVSMDAFHDRARGEQRDDQYGSISDSP